MRSGKSAEARLPEKGEIWAQKYQVLGPLGTGGMGRVLAAQHLVLGRRVALKFLTDNRPSSVRRFVDEARAAQSLTSEHVVRVFDIAYHEDVPCLVMELLEGEDLAELLRQGGPLPLAEAIDYVIQACTGMAEAHAAGIVHRDLKPSNLFRVRRATGHPLIKVVDFGISKELSRLEREATSPRSLLGSPYYMSPEQLRDAQRVDARADVWALAVTLYTLLEDKPPFAGDTLAEVSVAIAVDSPAPLVQVSEPERQALSPVLARALDKQLELRTPDVVSFAKELTPFASAAGRMLALQLEGRYGTIAQPARHSLAARERAPKAAARAVELTATDPRRRSASPWLPRARAKQALLTLTLIALGVALFMTLRAKQLAAHAEVKRVAAVAPAPNEAPSPAPAAVQTASIALATARLASGAAQTAPANSTKSQNPRPTRKSPPAGPVPPVPPSGADVKAAARGLDIDGLPIVE